MLADGVVLLHFLWILFLIFGALAGRSIRWVKVLHLGALIYSLALQGFGWTCPLTVLEVWLRAAQTTASDYRGGFIRHYVERIVYLDLPPRSILLGTLLVVTVSLWIYFRPEKK
jgi:hypothetical protein